MKHLFLIFILIFSLNTYSQDYGEFKFGLEVGPTINLLRGERYSSFERFKPAVRFSLGFSFEIEIKNRFSIKTGFNLGKKGMEETYNEIDTFGFDYGEISVSHIYNYLTIPFLGKYYLDKKSEYFVTAGIYTGFLLKRSEFIRGTGSNPETPDLTEHSKQADFGLSFGGGYTKKMSDQISMMIELRNDFGLSNTSKLSLPEDTETKNNSTMFLFGMTYTFKY